ncbi:MAG: STAS domain-containing protein [Bifidobacterium sp.]|uniref:Anti-sigma factor antagonist n=1 Tax=Bifidobacterium fermentum TaxID=3059035 RepID=A0AB39UQ94_9BIFI
MNDFNSTHIAEGRRLVVNLNGRLDTNTSPAFEESMQSEFQEGRDMVFDCTNLEYISSAGLRVLLLAYKKTKGLDASLSLRNLNADVLNIIEMVGFSDFLSIE